MQLRLPTLAGLSPIAYMADGLAVVFGEIRDHTAEFTAAQMSPVSRAVAKRRQEFSTGRFFALIAQELLGLSPVFVPSSRSRRPIWPEGLIGSISHSEKYVIVVLSPDSRWAGVGVDLEAEGRVTQPLLNTILTPSEIQSLPLLTSIRAAPTVFFSGKESLFKAVNPIYRVMIGFHEVELALDSAGSFAAKYMGLHALDAPISTGQGNIEYYEDHVVTLFLLPGVDARRG